jgi:hypothetical protein
VILLFPCLFSSLDCSPDINILEGSIWLSFRFDKTCLSFFLGELTNDSQEIINGGIGCLNMDNETRAAEEKRFRKI